jgi:hypothetical protein
MNTLVHTIIRGALLCLLLTSVSFAARASRAPVSPKQLENQYKQEELTSRQNEQQTLEAKQTRAQLLRSAQDTLQALRTLAQQATSFSTKMETLLDSDAGKRVARDGVRFTTYINLQDYPAATMNEVTLKTDAASALLNRLQLAEEGPDVGFVPSAKTQQEVDDLQIWAKTKLTILENQTATLDTITRTAPQDIDLAQTKPLRTAVEECKAQWSMMVAEYQARGQKLASPNAKETILLAAYQAKLDRANAEAQRIIDTTQATIDKMKQEFEVALLQQKQQAAQELSAARQQYEDKLAQIQRSEKAAQTDRTIQDRTAALNRDAKVAAMDRQELIALAKSPEVQQLLAPFITPGYSQPRQRQPTYDKMPVSLNVLKTLGALRPTSDGLKALLDCGMTKADRERPRWSFHPRYLDLTPGEHEKLRQAQEYLIQLGDIMVELGMLSQ